MAGALEMDNGVLSDRHMPGDRAPFYFGVA